MAYSTLQYVLFAPSESDFLALPLNNQTRSIKTKFKNMQKQKITPCLWFDFNAEEAMNFYTSVFKNSKIIAKSYYGDAGPGPKGALMVATFELDGQEFIALNGGSQYKFTEAISMSVDCHTQEEVDYYWEKLSEGGMEVQCGWLKDKFGLAWQIVPDVLPKMMMDKDPAKAKRVTEAMFKMIKIDIAALEKAYAQ
jgi:predicted 3-demethylubiquinone-9 3-methyltransferase (glyoxalase superfamily)